MRDEERKMSVSRDGGEDAVESEKIEAGMKTGKQTYTESIRTHRHTRAKSYLALTVADLFVRHVVSGGEAVFGHGHVGVEGEGQQAGGRLDLWGDLCPAVPADQRSHCRQTHR